MKQPREMEIFGALSREQLDLIDASLRQLIYVANLFVDIFVDCGSLRESFWLVELGHCSFVRRTISETIPLRIPTEQP